MSKPIAVLGYGPVGRATTEAILRSGRAVRVAQRTAPKTLPAGATFLSTDILDADAVVAALDGAAQAVITVGFPYDSSVWKSAWPRAMSNVLNAAAAHRIRVVFADNLYMYGPRTEPLHEAMPLTSFGNKPAVRAGITRMWLAAQDGGAVRFAALRAPDFFGPGAGAQSQLGDLAFGALANGKRASLIAPPDMPHAFAYVPDFARGIVTLLDAPDDAFGQAWHLPTAPIRTPREILTLGAATLGVTPRISALPLWSLPLLGFAVPILRELAEMRFQFDRPYRVDHSRFGRRFWSDATPFEISAAVTALAYRTAPA